jgi:thiamine-monophosphate kinase
MNEFDLIARYFNGLGAHRPDVALGVGDDGAVLDCAVGQSAGQDVGGHEQLVACIDTLVEGVHFPAGCDPRSVGHRALAVNLSDLAAMGARPAWALLALTLPAVDESWLSGFARGLSDLATAHGVALVGGDTTSGPLCVTVQALGFVPRGAALRRAGGRPGDVLFVSGTPGDAAAGLAIVQGRLAALDPYVRHLRERFLHRSSVDQTEQADRVDRADPSDLALHAHHLRERFLYPAPRLSLGLRLRDFASSCIDVSDGLLADCGKLAAASGCGAALDKAALPLSAALRAVAGAGEAARLALTGGDDYELAFSVPADRVEALLAACPPAEWGYSRIGELRLAPGAAVYENGVEIPFISSGYDHFL